MSDEKCFTSLLPFLFCVLGWWPQQDLATDARHDSGSLIVSTDVDLVILNVSVKNAKGDVSGLAAEDFRVYEDKKPQQIKYFSHSEIPVTIGLVIDNSGSMRARRPGMITAALALVGASSPRDEIFEVNFNDRVRRGLPSDVLFSDDIQTLRKALWIGNSEGRTKLYDALGYSLQYLDSKGRMDKKTLMVVSGGEYFQLREVPEIATACKKIAKDIRNRYTIAYIPSHLGSPRSVHLVKVTASAPSREKLIVRTRSR